MEMQSLFLRFPSVQRPEWFPAGAVLVDLETQKEELEEPLQVGPGFALRRKWVPFLIGTGFFSDDGFVVELRYGWQDGATFVDAFAEAMDGARVAMYTATREFDEMVLKGRFTNARRAHLSARPEGWLGVDEERYEFRNIRGKIAESAIRGEDIASRDVPAGWARGEIDLVLVHCARDVLSMVCPEDTESVEFLSDLPSAMKTVADFA